MFLLISAVLRAHFPDFSLRNFRASATVVFFFLVLFFLAGLHCLLKMHVINSCVGDT